MTRPTKIRMEEWIYNALWSLSHEKEAMNIFWDIMHDKENPVPDWLLDEIFNVVSSVKAERFVSPFK